MSEGSPIGEPSFFAGYPYPHAVFPICLINKNICPIFRVWDITMGVQIPFIYIYKSLRKSYLLICKFFLILKKNP